MPYQDPFGGGAPGGDVGAGGYSGLYGLPGFPGSAGGIGQFQPWQTGGGGYPVMGRRRLEAPSFMSPYGPAPSGGMSPYGPAPSGGMSPYGPAPSGGANGKCYDVAGREVPCSGNPAPSGGANGKCYDVAGREVPCSWNPAPYGGGGWGQPASPPTAPDPRRMAYPTRTRLPPDQRCYSSAGTEVPCHGNPPGHYHDPKIPVGEWKDPGTGEVYRGPEVGTTNGGQGYGGGGTQAGGAGFPLSLQELFRNYAKAGYFDPRGNQMLIESGRQNAAASSAATQRQMSLAAQSRGTDPTQRASYELQAMLGGQGAQMNQINQLMNAAAQNQNQFAQGLGMAWGGQQPLPADTSPGAADYAIQLILAYLTSKIPGGK